MRKSAERTLETAALVRAIVASWFVHRRSTSMRASEREAAEIVIGSRANSASGDRLQARI